MKPSSWQPKEGQGTGHFGVKETTYPLPNFSKLVHTSRLYSRLSPPTHYSLVTSAPTTVFLLSFLVSLASMMAIFLFISNTFSFQELTLFESRGSIIFTGLQQGWKADFPFRLPESHPTPMTGSHRHRSCPCTSTEHT